MELCDRPCLKQRERDLLVGRRRLLTFSTRSPLITEFNDVSSSLSFSMQPTTLAAVSSSTAVATPLRRLAVASTTACAKEASDYGKCIVATYTDVHKDTCKAEFDKFGACLRRTVRCSWFLTILAIYNSHLPT